MKKAWKYLDTKTGERVKVDTEDFDRVSNHSWRVISSGKNKKRSVVTSIRTKQSVRTMTLGQFILKPKKGLFVYPRRWQGGLDYRKNNLIICSMRDRQRMLPKRGAENSTSIYKGVSFIKTKKVWRSRIEVRGKSIFLGDFKTEAAAARSYNKAAKEYFGDFAYINQVNRTPDRRTQKKK